ncbi:MAG: hypothetical protein EOM05_10975 [Clostridia bacterium]|nr:hypothetical protein [Clostridia bacterium]
MTIQEFVKVQGGTHLVGKIIVGVDVNGIEREGICLGFDGNKATLDFTNEGGYPYKMDYSTLKVKEIIHHSEN